VTCCLWLATCYLQSMPRAKNKFCNECNSVPCPTSVKLFKHRQYFVCFRLGRATGLIISSLYTNLPIYTNRKVKSERFPLRPPVHAFINCNIASLTPSTLLLNICKSKDPSLEELEADCEFLNAFYIDTRYPVHWPTHFSQGKPKRPFNPPNTSDPS